MDAESEGAFTEWVTARTPALLRFGLLLTGNRADAEDVVQAALVRTYRAWPRVDDPDAFVRRVITNAHRSWWRRGPRQEIPVERLPDVASGDAASDVDVHDALWSALATLPRRMRAVLVLRYYEGLTEAETARVLGCAVGTVKSQSAKALEKLRGESGLRSAFASIGETT